ncbi:MAG: TraB/GumN family protein, partial [Fulvivirga sp.]|nr:TraB/GumN family protein [Fulvivirga sp.]
MIHSQIKKFYFLSILCLFLSSGVQAQESSLLWKISGNGLEKPSYIFGTVHLICPEDMLLSEQTKQALEKSEQVVMEIDADDPDLQTKMAQMALNEGMKNFSENMKEEDINVLNEFFMSSYGANLGQLGVMKPFALMSMMLPKALDCNKAASYERTFVELKKDKELLGLETAAMQIGFFDKIPQK